MVEFRSVLLARISSAWIATIWQFCHKISFNRWIIANSGINNDGFFLSGIRQSNVSSPVLICALGLKLGISPGLSSLMDKGLGFGAKGIRFESQCQRQHACG